MVTLDNLFVCKSCELALSQQIDIKGIITLARYPQETKILNSFKNNLINNTKPQLKAT